MIVAMNLLVVGVGVAVGWVGIEVAGRNIEHKLVNEPVANAALLINRMRLDLRDSLLVQLGEVLDARLLAVSVNGGPAIATSMDPGDTAAALNALEADGGQTPATMQLGNVRCRVGVARMMTYRVDGRPGEPVYLYMIVPEAKVSAAKREAARTIALVTLCAIALATALAFTVSFTISRPVRNLADRMDLLAEQPQLAGAGAQVEAAGPAEIQRLARSFDQLLARLDEAREAMARQARLAALGQVAATVAHELRNPLSGIKMNARVLADELAAAGVEDQSLQQIVREIDRTDLYLKELLGVAAGEAGPGQVEPALADVKLAGLTDSVLTLVQGRCSHQGITVERTGVDSAAVVRADADQLRQVLLNLVLNAIDAMPHGGCLTLSTRPEGGRVRFSVTDTGGGVSVPDSADIFEPFVTTKPRGTGLGLFVCRQIIDGHNGRLGYVSSEGGSTFYFELSSASGDS